MKDYHFMLEESNKTLYLKFILGSEYFDEVGCWLKNNNFGKYVDFCKAKGVFQLKEFSTKLVRSDMKKVLCYFNN